MCVWLDLGETAKIFCLSDLCSVRKGPKGENSFQFVGPIAAERGAQAA